MVGEKILVGIDVGTSKICSIVGELKESGAIEVIGVASTPSVGLKKGVVINIESTARSIRKAVDAAERMADVEIDSAYVGIAGSHITSLNSRGVIAVSGENREITEDDVRRVTEAAEAISLPNNRQIIHSLPREYIVDDQDGIKDPIGMSGIRLEADVHIVTGAMTAIQNVIKSVERADIDVDNTVLEPLASSEAVLSIDEKDLGVVLVDIGGGTTDVAVFTKGSILHSAVIPVGGDHVTNDIAVGLRTPTRHAEQLKIDYGAAKIDMVSENEMIDVVNTGGQSKSQVPRRLLCQIIQSRMEEVYSLIKAELDKAGCKDIIPAGIVVCGGGSLLEGGCQLAEEILGCSVRVGYPQGIDGLTDKVASPCFATAVGLLFFGKKNPVNDDYIIENQSLFSLLIKRIKDWFSDFF